MGSCCRRSGVRAAQIAAHGFCGSLTLATSVSFQLAAEGPTAIIPLGHEALPIGEVMTKFKCSAVRSVGVKLAEIVALALKKAWSENEVAVRAMLNERMPMLTAKRRLFEVITKCQTCSGAGCPLCKNLGFQV